VTGRAPVRRALLAVVGFYSRAISPALPPRCRFHPTCSAYAAEAIERHGAARGSWLALRRILKCAPWHPGGLDPVPVAPGTGEPGTSEPAHASSTEVQATTAPEPDRATPPALRRATEETFVA
jgi:putative membrane protein insertion efficiency factor